MYGVLRIGYRIPSENSPEGIAVCEVFESDSPKTKWHFGHVDYQNFQISRVSGLLTIYFSVNRSGIPQLNPRRAHLAC